MKSISHKKGFVAYLRVSTQRQGTQGTSPSEQRRLIERFAETRNLFIQSWRTEMHTAADRDRPVFHEVMEDLKRGHSAGLIVHKIDRSARNLSDWARLSELIDSGVAVHFVQDDLDLQSRSGRLTADIQAILAADYIRNLREETCKGLRGRLAQGLYPFSAPLGYLDCGTGKVKRLDPERAAYVRKLFEMYVSGGYTLKTLAGRAAKDGFRNRQGRVLLVATLSRMLNNRFYTGVTRLRHTGEEFAGNHEPLVSEALFEDVRKLLRARRGRHKRRASTFRFTAALSCSRCGRSLVGECQKGHIYYRCHGSSCRLCVREEVLALLLSMDAESSNPAGGLEEKVAQCDTAVHRKGRSTTPYSRLSTVKVAQVATGGHSNDSIRTPEEVAEEAWVIGKERLQKAREEQERLIRDREQKRRAEKPEPASPPAYHPNSIQAILGQLDPDSAADSTVAP